MKIDFGTDGWRGIIGEDFNFENVKKIGFAILKFLEENKKNFPINKKEIIIGYDTRFLGKESLKILTNIFSNYGFKTYISKEPISTPSLSFMVKKLNLPLGIMLTASHNPAIYNGIKIKAWYGGSALPEIYGEVKKNLNKDINIKRKKGEVQEVDILKNYIKYLKEKVEWEKIIKVKGKILWDPIFGATGKILKEIFKEFKGETKVINDYPDPYFGGIQPEPIPQNLKNTIKYLKKNKFDLAGTSDGDGDRIGLIDEKGNFLWNHQIFSILALFHIKERGEKRGIAKTFSGSLYLNRIAKKYKVPLYETKIGFKYLCPYLMEGKVFIAGEESGGIAFYNSLPERDAVLSFLKILEILSLKKKSLKFLEDEIIREFGELFYERIDIPMEILRAKNLVKKIYKNPIKKFANYEVKKIKKLDGVKFYFKEEGWLLFRASGTENLLRIYCEMDKKEKIEEILSSLKNFLKNYD